MCKVCDKIRDLNLSANVALSMIQDEVDDDVPIEHFKDIIDELLGTGLDDQDEDLGRAWEAERGRK
jgi:hypothetical protein